jgi:hypothetical protein
MAPLRFGTRRPLEPVGHAFRGFRPVGSPGRKRWSSSIALPARKLRGCFCTVPKMRSCAGVERWPGRLSRTSQEALRPRSPRRSSRHPLCCSLACWTSGNAVCMPAWNRSSWEWGRSEAGRVAPIGPAHGGTRTKATPGAGSGVGTDPQTWRGPQARGKKRPGNFSNREAAGRPYGRRSDGQSAVDAPDYGQDRCTITSAGHPGRRAHRRPIARPAAFLVPRELQKDRRRQSRLTRPTVSSHYPAAPLLLPSRRPRDQRRRQEARLK